MHHLIIFADDKGLKPIKSHLVAQDRAIQNVADGSGRLIAAVAIQLARRCEHVCNQLVDTRIKTVSRLFDARLQLAGNATGKFRQSVCTFRLGEIAEPFIDFPANLLDGEFTRALIEVIRRQRDIEEQTDEYEGAEKCQHHIQEADLVQFQLIAPMTPETLWLNRRIHV